MLGTWYFWQQRFDALVATPDSPWFDDIRTPDRRETLADVIRAAAPRARAQLEAAQGKDPAAWRWGKAHTLRFVSPLRRSGAGQELVGRLHARARRAAARRSTAASTTSTSPTTSNFFASMQVVVDFADTEKIEAILAGGVSERHFQPHQNDQAKLWAAGQRRAWWFDPAKAEAHAKITRRAVALEARAAGGP